MRSVLVSILLFCLLPAFASSAQNATLGLNASQLYEKGMNSLLGVGVSRNDLNAVDYFRRSAELGYPQAQVVLGYFYDTGNVVFRTRSRLLTGTGKPPARTIASPTGCWDGSITVAAEFHGI